MHFNIISLGIHRDLCVILIFLDLLAWSRILENTSGLYLGLKFFLLLNNLLVLSCDHLFKPLLIQCLTLNEVDSLGLKSSHVLWLGHTVQIQNVLRSLVRTAGQEFWRTFVILHLAIDLVHHLSKRHGFFRSILSRTFEGFLHQYLYLSLLFGDYSV